MTSPNRLERIAARRQALANASNADEICRVVRHYAPPRIFGCQPMYVIDLGEVQSLFDGLGAESFVKALAASDVASLNSLAGTLQQMYSQYGWNGAPLCDGLDYLHGALVRRVRQVLEQAGNAAEIEQALSVCCSFSDIEMVTKLMGERFTEESLIKALSTFHAVAFHDLWKCLQGIWTRLGQPPFEGLQQVRALLRQRVRQELEHASNASQINGAILICYEYVCADPFNSRVLYGCGAIDNDMVLSVFEGITGQRFTRALLASDHKSLSYLNRHLLEMSRVMGELQCEGLELLRQAIALLKITR